MVWERTLLKFFDKGVYIVQIELSHISLKLVYFDAFVLMNRVQARQVRPVYSHDAN
jgi:hypothetical protein